MTTARPRDRVMTQAVLRRVGSLAGETLAVDVEDQEHSSKPGAPAVVSRVPLWCSSQHCPAHLVALAVLCSVPCFAAFSYIQLSCAHSS